MNAFFKPNLGTGGRVVRGSLAVVAAASAGYLWRTQPEMSVLLALLAIFMGFQALRGWCFARACRLKTPL